MYITLEEDKLEGIKESLTLALKYVNVLLTSVEIKKTAPFSKMSKADQLEHLKTGMSSFFNVPVDSLFSNRRQAYLTKRKKFAAKILSCYSTYTQEEIADILHYSERSSVSNAIDKLDEWLLPKPFGDDSIKKEWDNLLLHLRIYP
jgi:chromosomal replication initiation ATPase DnaA